MGEIIILKIIIMIDFEMNSMIRKEYLIKTKSKKSQIVENLCVENFWVGTWTVEKHRPSNKGFSVWSS